MNRGGRTSSPANKILARIYLGDSLRYTVEPGSDPLTVLLHDATNPDDVCDLDRRLLAVLGETLLRLSAPQGMTVKLSARRQSAAARS